MLVHIGKTTVEQEVRTGAVNEVGRQEGNPQRAVRSLESPWNGKVSLASVQRADLIDSGQKNRGRTSVCRQQRGRDLADETQGWEKESVVIGGGVAKWILMVGD